MHSQTTDADLQRLTWNEYYGENCFKGGVWTSLGGFHGTYTLWPGAVSDSDYNRRAGYIWMSKKSFKHERYS